MSFIAASAILLVIASAQAVLLRRELSETVFLAAVAVTGILYCFALLNFKGCLRLGVLFVAALGALCLVFLIYIFFKRKQSLADARLADGCLIYLLFLALSLALNAGRTYREWDEFSHWGVIVKHFFAADALGTVRLPEYAVMAPSYYPGTSIFQYFFSRFSADFTE